MNNAIVSPGTPYSKKLSNTQNPSVLWFKDQILIPDYLLPHMVYILFKRSEELIQELALCTMDVSGLYWYTHEHFSPEVSY